MKKFVLLTTLAAFTVAAGAAQAVTVTNSDKTDAVFSVNIGGKAETVTLKEHATYDSKGKDAGITIGTEKPVLAKGEEHLIIKGGKLEAAPAKAAAVETKMEQKVEAKAEEKAAPVTLSSAPAKAEAPAKASN